MSKPGGIGVAFVDTLTCGLGALLLLWMALAATPAREAGVPGQGVLLKLNVLPDAARPNEASPLLALRLKSSGQYLVPNQINERGELHVSPASDGATGYDVLFTSQGRADDELVVCVHDWNGKEGTGPVTVAISVTGPTGTDSYSMKLPPDEPVKSMLLKAVLEGQPIVWK